MDADAPMTCPELLGPSANVSVKSFFGGGSDAGTGALGGSGRFSSGLRSSEDARAIKDPSACVVRVLQNTSSRLKPSTLTLRLCLWNGAQVRGVPPAATMGAVSERPPAARTARVKLH